MYIPGSIYVYIYIYIYLCMISSNGSLLLLRATTHRKPCTGRRRHFHAKEEKLCMNQSQSCSEKKPRTGLDDYQGSMKANKQKGLLQSAIHNREYWLYSHEYS